MIDRLQLTNDLYDLMSQTGFVPIALLPMLKPILLLVVRAQSEERLAEIMKTGKEILGAIQDPDPAQARATLNRILIDPLLKNGHVQNQS